MTPRLHGRRLALLLLPLLWVSSAAATEATPLYTYRVVNVYPHDPKAFTQGLVFDGGFLYEGTGLHGESTLRKVELKSGRVVKRFELPSRFFGEGITVFGEYIIQTTWRSNVAFVYDKRSFELRQTFVYPTEAWGLTHNGRHLILSDGTATLRYLDPQTFREVDRIEVYDGKNPVPHLNELEFVRGEILANVWKTDRIARIAPESGRVTGWIDLSGILKSSRGVDVLNGIAYDAANDRLFVTGKLWPKLFEIDIVPAAK